MAYITLHRKQRTKLALPYWVFVNGQAVGIMRTPEVSIMLPEGTFDIAVRLVFGFGKWTFGIGGERTITTSATPMHISISDKERWWNFFFDLDLVVWLVGCFIDFLQPWDVVYHVLSEGFFAIWLLRIFIRRRRYFILTETAK